MQRHVVLGVLAVVFGLQGCGGNGAGPSFEGRPPTPQTKDRVQRTFGIGLNSLALSGAKAGGGALRDGSSQDSGASFSMLGGFLRDAGLTNAGVTRRDPTTGSGGSNGWVGGSGHYFDEWLGLWVDAQFSGNRATFALFVDEAMTRPAGSLVSEFPTDPGHFPQECRSRHEILAGLLAGSRGFYEMTFQTETEGSMRWQNSNPDEGTDEGSATWNGNEYGWANSYRGQDGFWSNDSGTFGADGSGSARSVNSWGYRNQFTYLADGSASGVMEGPDAGLPAQISWDANGRGRIRWADGTVEEFDWAWCVAGANGDEPGP